jgi:hypothetical protein
MQYWRKWRSVIVVSCVMVSSAMLLAACSTTPKVSPYQPDITPSLPVAALDTTPMQQNPSCDLTDSCPIEKPAAPFNVMGAVIGGACPPKETLLARFAVCQNGLIAGITVIIPALDEAAKARVFARALVKYGAPYEDRTGGVPMQSKVDIPDWAASKTPPQLAETRGKRYMFWWIDQVAKHYLAVSELDEAVKIMLRRDDDEARRLANDNKSAADKLSEQGAKLTAAF